MTLNTDLSTTVSRGKTASGTKARQKVQPTDLAELRGESANKAPHRGGTAGISGMRTSFAAAVAESPERPREPFLITVNELAHLLGISARTVWRLLSSGEMVEPVRFGKNVRWRLEEVRQWIAAGCPRLVAEVK